MRRIAGFAVTFVAWAAALSGVALGDDSTPHAIDVAHSKAAFSVSHVFVEHVSGTVPIVSGTVILRTGSAIPVSIVAVLNPGRVSTGDADRDASLKSPDFFDAQKFPTWTFVSTKITPHGKDSFGVDGTLTLHGATEPEHLDVTVVSDPAHLAYRATGQIDRRGFGMPVTRLDPVIGTTASIALDVILK
jgi:polyisoprenoid-binding protein YceI